MPTVAELTEPYGNFMLGPVRGPRVCDVCLTFIDGYPRCYTCARTPQALDVLAPISYSVAAGQLHHVLAAYKRQDGRVGRRLSTQLAAVLWRFLSCHEHCLAQAAGVPSFDLVATVPSGVGERDRSHPLHRIVSEMVGPTRDRHRRLLGRSTVSVAPHEFDRRRYEATGRVPGAAVLVIDDTWTTGASVQSAATVLKEAGAQTVAAVVIGRHLNRKWGENERRLRALTRPFDWTRCAYCDADPRAPERLPSEDGGYQPPCGL
jgi:predicted amidophosphoribosyltransferase